MIKDDEMNERRKKVDNIRSLSQRRLFENPQNCTFFLFNDYLRRDGFLFFYKIETHTQGHRICLLPGFRRGWIMVPFYGCGKKNSSMAKRASALEIPSRTMIVCSMKTASAIHWRVRCDSNTIHSNDDNSNTDANKEKETITFGCVCEQYLR